MIETVYNHLFEFASDSLQMKFKEGILFFPIEVHRLGFLAT